MADKEAPISIIQTSFAAGELAPNVYGRTDLAKFHQGCITAKNFFVDYRGGASSRPGTQYIGQPGSTGLVRLRAFKFSAAIGQTYMLVFSNLKLRFIKNPGGVAYPNGSNAGLILSGGVPYELATSYAEADLAYLKFSQVGDKLTITRQGYPRTELARISDTNWTLTAISNNPVMNTPPVIANGTISALPAGSTDPQKTRYMYVVTGVDKNGNESPPSVPFIVGPGINLGATQGTVTIFWSAITNAVYYKIYKGLPTPGDKFPDYSEQVGFAGYSYGTLFLDSNIVPDFTLSPPEYGTPFDPGQITGYTITGTSGDWPVGGTGITVTGGGGSGAIIYPVLNNNAAAGVGSITGLYIKNRGSGYTSAPTLTATGAGGTVFTATAIVGPTTGLDPDVVSVFQQREVFGSTTNQPSTIFLSRPDRFTDFRRTNPVNDGDSFEFTIATQEITDIVWLQSMPGGLVIGTDSGIVQLTAGSSSAANPAAVTSTSAVIVPQSYYGAADIHPIVIDYDILYIQSKASIVRDLQYNFFVNIYTGTDITVLSSHLFYPNTIVDWAYQDTPNKVIWCVRSDGVLLSLTFLKSQELLGWTRHETNGRVEAIDVVQEGPTDAIYLAINRNGTRFIERLCDKVYNQADDAWCLDAALSTATTYPAANISFSALTGNITVTADAAIFGAGDVGKVLRASKGKATVTAFTNATHVNATVVTDYDLTAFTAAVNTWRLDPLVSSISGLAHLNGYSAYALVDGLVQGPFTVSGGSITLSAAGSSVVVGLLYQCQLQPIFLDVGQETTLQGSRKKITAATLRIKDTSRLKWGPDFSELNEFVQNVSGTDPEEILPKASKLATGDQRMIINQFFNRIGSIAIQQDFPLPATITAGIMEVAQGDTR